MVGSRLSIPDSPFDLSCCLVSREQAEWVARHQQKRDLLVDAATKVLDVGSCLTMYLHIPSRLMRRPPHAVADDLVVVDAAAVVAVAASVAAV
jgi:hypothetical protein